MTDKERSVDCAPLNLADCFRCLELALLAWVIGRKVLGGGKEYMHNCR